MFVDDNDIMEVLKENISNEWIREKVGFKFIYPAASICTNPNCNETNLEYSSAKLAKLYTLKNGCIPVMHMTKFCKTCKATYNLNDKTEKHENNRYTQTWNKSLGSYMEFGAHTLIETELISFINSMLTVTKISFDQSTNVFNHYFHDYHRKMEIKLAESAECFPVDQDEKEDKEYVSVATTPAANKKRKVMKHSMTYNYRKRYIWIVWMLTRLHYNITARTHLDMCLDYHSANVKTLDDKIDLLLKKYMKNLRKLVPDVYKEMSNHPSAAIHGDDGITITRPICNAPPQVLQCDIIKDPKLKNVYLKCPRSPQRSSVKKNMKKLCKNHQWCGNLTAAQIDNLTKQRLWDIEEVIRFQKKGKNAGKLLVTYKGVPGQYYVDSNDLQMTKSELQKLMQSKVSEGTMAAEQLDFITNFDRYSQIDLDYANIPVFINDKKIQWPDYIAIGNTIEIQPRCLKISEWSKFQIFSVFNESLSGFLSCSNSEDQHVVLQFEELEKGKLCRVRFNFND